MTKIKIVPLNNRFKLRIEKQIYLVIIFLSEFARADNIMSGLQKASSYLRSGAIIISTIAVIAAGLIMAFNKERGFDKMSGAVIGLVCIAGASGIVALIQSFFS